MIQYTLKLFKILLDKKPVGLPEEIENKALKDYENLKIKSQNFEEVEQAMILYGRQSWPYRQAEKEFLDLYGKTKQNDLFLDLLPDELRKKWQTFEEQGGSIHDYRHGKEVENKFSSEEELLISATIIESEEAIRDYLNNLASGDKMHEYFETVKKYQLEVKNILSKIQELVSLKERSGKWKMEINDEIKCFDKGFAEIEERPTVQKVQEKLDFYLGQIESGNK